jgi:hypothetical protein
VELCLRKLILGEDIAPPTIRHGTVIRFLEEQFLDHSQIAAVGRP